MHDAIQAFEGRYESYGAPIPNATGSPVAAAASAAHSVLIHRFPESLATTLEDYLSGLAFRCRCRSAGRRIGDRGPEMGCASLYPRLALALLLGLAGVPAAPAQAQIPASNQGLVVRDGSLGSAPGGVVAPGPDDLGQADYLIRADLGEQRGTNLFHSFLRFSIGSGERATFTDQGAPDPGAIENVISRVTGGELSQIDGKLHSTIPGADVWLLNPNGVVFGEGAELDVKGSFHAAAADYLGFEGGLERFYGDPSRPSVLSTARPAAFGFLPGGGAASLAVDRSHLDVGPGETLELVGGDLSLTGAKLLATGGHVGLEAQGEVELTDAVVGGKSVPSLVDVGGEAPGTISIRGRQIVVEKGSQVLAENQGAGPGGHIGVAAIESLTVDTGLLSVSTSSAGDAGTIASKGGEIVLRNGPGLVDINESPTDRANLPHRTTVGASAETTGSGAAGLIEIDAQSLVFENGAGISAQTVGADGAAAVGAGGTVRIAGAQSVLVADRGFVSVDSWSSLGDAGRIEIEDIGALTVDGDWLTILTAGSLGSTSRFQSSPEPALGKAGTIDILRAKSVTLLNGGLVQSACFDCVLGGGRIRVQAESLRVEGNGTLSTVNARRFYGIGSSISAHAFGGTGRAGDILIELTGSLELLRGGFISASATDGARGNAGNIRVYAKDVTIQRLDPNSRGAGITAYAADFYGNPATGDAGTIHLEADSLHLGSPGPRQLGGNRSVLYAVSSHGTAGTISVDVGTLEIQGEGAIDVTAEVEGGPGSITLVADSVSMGPGGIVTSRTTGSADGGDITIETGSLDIRDGGLITAETTGTGNAGGITVDADSVVIGDEGRITAEARVTGTPDNHGGNAGHINLVVDSLEIQTGGAITTSSIFGGVYGGDAGDIDVTASDWISMTNVGGDRFDLDGVLRRTTSLSGIFSATVGSGGTAGSIRLAAPEITVTDGAIVASSTIGGGAGGSVALSGDRIRIANGGFVDTTTLPLTSPVFVPGGPAGDVTLEAKQWIEVGGADEFGDPSFVASRSVGLGTGLGEAGDVTLWAPSIRLFDGGSVTTNADQANGGDITLHAQKLVHLDRGVITSSVNGETGGNITIDPVFVILENGSQIVATATTGRGGRIQITTDNFFAFPGSVVSALSDIPELSGTVEVHSPDVDLASTLTPLPSGFLDAASLMRERCAARRGGERAGSFSVRGPGGIPSEPDGWLRAPVVLPAPATPTAAAPGPSELVASLPGPALAHGACP